MAIGGVTQVWTLTSWKMCTSDWLKIDCTSNSLDSLWNIGWSNSINYNSWSVGIWTVNPGTKLDVNWTVKSSAIESRGTTMKISLAQCGWPCGSYHAINAWVNVSSYWYNWSTPINTDNNWTFSHNNKWTITVNKNGVYRIREQVMMIPTANIARIYGCPYINGSADCGHLGAADWLRHSYYPAGWWAQNATEFIFELSAGSTVGYGYYIYNAMSYWAHDTYTYLEITRIN